MNHGCHLSDWFIMELYWYSPLGSGSDIWVRIPVRMRKYVLHTIIVYEQQIQLSNKCSVKMQTTERFIFECLLNAISCVYTKCNSDFSAWKEINRKLIALSEFCRDVIYASANRKEGLEHGITRVCKHNNMIHFSRLAVSGG